MPRVGAFFDMDKTLIAENSDDPDSVATAAALLGVVLLQ